MRTFFLILLTLGPLMAAPEPKETKGVDVTLVSANTRIAAGKTFRVGLKIHHHEGYHTYWQSPGVAGVPTEIEWQLPAGFTAGPIQWPFPEKTKMAIHPVHGYERDVMLLVDIQAPREINEASVKLQATASWMACADGCYPGKTDLELVLPVSSAVEIDSTKVEAFSRAEAEVPKPLENWKVQLLTAKDAKEIRIQLVPLTPDAVAPGELYFYSSDGQVSSDRPQRMDVDKGGKVVITLERSEDGPKGKAILPGILQTNAPLDASGKVHLKIDPAYSKD